MKQIALLHGKPSRLKGSMYPIRRISRIAKTPTSSLSVEPGLESLETEEPTAFIGPGVECKGVIVGDGKMQIDGSLEGEIHSNASVVVGSEGMVDANIHAESIISDGRITGNVSAKKNIHLKSSAVMKGSIKTPYLSMEEGAILETDWSIWINGGRIPGNMWQEHFQRGHITHPPWWPSEVIEPVIR